MIGSLLANIELTANEAMRYRGYQKFYLSPIWIIIAINLLLLVATFISPRLIFLLGLMPELFLSRPWTIVTNIFMHSGLLFLASEKKPTFGSPNGDHPG